MRPTLRALATLNTATAVWLTVMFVVLRHEDYLRNALLAFAIALLCVWSVRASRALAPSWERHGVTAGSVGLAGYGAWAIYCVLQPGADFEGFVLAIGAAWILQGLTALVVYASAGAAPADGPSA